MSKLSSEEKEVHQSLEAVEQGSTVELPKVVKMTPTHNDQAQAKAKSDGNTSVTKPMAKKGSKKPKVKKKTKANVKTKVGLKPTDTMAEAGRKVLALHFGRMVKHEPGTRLGEDIEALHEMRVATRRMRAAFNVFGNVYTKKVVKPLLAGLKATGRALGPVRDLDVFIQKLHTYQASLTEQERNQLQPLLDRLQSQRTEARKRMVAHLNSKEYRKFKKQFRKFVETEGVGAKPVVLDHNPEPHELRHICPPLIYESYADVRAYETVLDDAPIETLHQLRIAFKRLRYTLEYLEEILGPEIGEVITEIKEMQDHLGDLNDTDVAGKIIKKFLKNLEQSSEYSPAEMPKSYAQIERYLTAKQNEQRELLASFPKAWKRFNRLALRKSLAKAVAVL